MSRNGSTIPQLLKRLQSYGGSMATCRDLGHAWDYEEWTPGGTRQLACRCGTKKKEVLDAGKIMSRQYAYITGYKIKGEGPVDVRIALRQLLAKDARKRATRHFYGR